MNMTDKLVLGTYGASHLGDAICLSPIIRQLCERRKVKAWVTRHPSTMAALAGNPYLAGFCDEQGLSADAQLRGRGHLIQRLQRGFDLDIEAIPKPEIYLSPNEVEWAKQQKALWPNSRRPICILSCRSISDADPLKRVNWKYLGARLSERFLVIQPVMTSSQVYKEQVCGNLPCATPWQTEPIATGAIVYRDLSVREYLALFSVADVYFGGPSGGSHAAAAFDLPSIIMIWRGLKNALRFPDQGRTVTTASFLYPQHHFICSEDCSPTFWNAILFEATLRKVLRECSDCEYKGQWRRQVEKSINTVHRSEAKVEFNSGSRIVLVPTK